MLAALLVIVMAGAVILGIGFGVYGKDTSQWFKPKQDASQGEEQPEQKPDESVVIRSDDAVGMLLSYGEASVASDGSTTQTITASIEPYDAGNQQVDWSVAFKDANSAWASGKNLSDYVTIAAESDGSKTAIVTCKQAFGEQVIITCTARDNADIFATATIDYAKRIVDVEVKIKQEGTEGYLSALDIYASGKLTSFEYVPVYSSVYTVEDTFTESVQHKVAASFYDAAGVSGSAYTKSLTDYVNYSPKFDNTSGSIFNMCYTVDSTQQKPQQHMKVLNAFKKKLATMTGADFLEIKIAYVGANSSAEFNKTVKIGTIDYTVSVTDVTLDKGGLIF